MLSILMAMMLMAEPVQLRIDHVGAEDRPVPGLVLYAAESQRDVRLPAECPKAAVCLAVEPESWRGLVAAAEALIGDGSHRAQRPLGSFRFRLVGGDRSVDVTLYPPESGAALSKMARSVTAESPRRELEKRAALGRN